MRLAFTINETLRQSATLGLIVLKADETIEHDMRRLLPHIDLALHVSRIESGDDLTVDSINAMREKITHAAALFPTASRFDVVGYACTSATSVIGSAEVASRIEAGCNARHVTEPVSALLAACTALSVRKIGFLSPYVESVSAHLRRTLEEAGLTIAQFVAFEEQSEARVARIDRQSIIRGATALAEAGGCEALFLSCTNLRTLDLIDEVETLTGLPVLSSNQVLAWHMAALTGLAMPTDAPGKLWQADIPANV